MGSNPLVSVIIPCFNVSSFVKKAVSSILEQTYANLEVIIVDDASTDETLDIIRNINDTRLRVVELKENSKKIGAVNTALQLVTGEFVAFQDADDWSEPNRIEQQVKIFHQLPDLGICFTNYRYNYKNSLVPNRIALTNEELKDEFLHFGSRKLTYLAPTMCATMMITKHVLRETGGYHPYFAGRVAEDIHWVYRILKVYRGIGIDKPLYNINIRSESLTQLQYTGENAKAAYSWQLLSKIIEKDLKYNIDVLDSSNCTILKKLELEACEEALVESLKGLQKIKKNYEDSFTYKLGKFLLIPIRLFKRAS